MNVSPVNNHQPFYTKEEVKNELKMAGVSAALSAGLTYAFNNPRNPKLALQTGGIMAGVSLAIGAVHKAFINAKNNRVQKTELQGKEE